MQEAFTCVREKFCSATMGTFVMAAVSLVLGKGAKERRLVAQLFDRLVKANMASRTQCTKGELINMCVGRCLGIKSNFVVS